MSYCATFARSPSDWVTFEKQDDSVKEGDLSGRTRKLWAVEDLDGGHIPTWLREEQRQSSSCTLMSDGSFHDEVAFAGGILGGMSSAKRVGV